MSKIWYCTTCGYEVGSRGRCHNCKQKLVLSPLPELVTESDEDEVGYRLDDWVDELRGQLISELIARSITHRFEDEELVVDTDDEEAVDALVSELAGAPVNERVADGDVVDDLDDDFGDGDGVVAGGPHGNGDGPAGPVLPEGVPEDTVLLASAAERLSVDPTDMQADGEVAEASTAVFLVDDPVGVDPETWNAVGRVTRRLMAALGSDDALEDEIRHQGGILARLLAPIVQAPVAPAGSVTAPVGSEEPAGAGVSPGAGEGGDDRSETVYELGEWLPEQRAELAILLDREGIASVWDGDNLVVASDLESSVEVVLDRIEAVEDPDADEEATYRAMEELFAATNRFVSDPSDRARGNDVVRAVGVADGPTPLGLDDAQWWQIRQRARILADSIEHKAQKDVVLTEARTLRDLLRGLM